MIFRRHLRCAKTTIATLWTLGVNNTCLPPFLAQRTRKGDLPMFQMRLFVIFSLQSPTVRKKNPQPGPKVSPVVLTNNAYEEQYFIPVLYRYQVPEQRTDHGSLCGMDTKGNIHAFVRTTMSAAMRPPPRTHTKNGRILPRHTGKASVIRATHVTCFMSFQFLLSNGLFANSKAISEAMNHRLFR